MSAVTGAGANGSGRPYRKLKPGPGRSAAAVAADQRSRIQRAAIELVAERGCEGLTVTEVTRLAGVSRRAFYREFDGADDCLIATYDLVVKCAARSILAAQPVAGSWAERLAAGMEAFCLGVDQNPAAARLGLIEVLGVGPAAVRRMQYTLGLFGALLGERIEGADGTTLRVAPVFVKAIAPGVSRLARVRLEATRAPGGLVADAGALVDWVTAICGSRTALPSPNRRTRPVTAAPRARPSAVPADERERILAAAESIAKEDGGAALTAAAIATAAGVSRRRLTNSFESPSKAFLAALDRRTEEVLGLIEDERLRAADWPRGVHRAIAAVCDRWAGDPDAARIAFTEQLAVGVAGMCRRERVLDEVAGRLALAENGAGEVAAIASLGAVWSVIFEAVITGRARSLPAVAPPLSFLLLAPVIGPVAATEAITEEVLEGYRGGSGSGAGQVVARPIEDRNT